MKTVQLTTAALLFWGFVPVMAAPPTVGLPATQSRAEKLQTVDDPANPLPINHIRGNNRIETSPSLGFTKQVSVDASKAGMKGVGGAHKKPRLELTQQELKSVVLPAPKASVPKSLLSDGAEDKLLPNRQVAKGIVLPTDLDRGLSKQAWSSSALGEIHKIAPVQPPLDKRDIR